MCCESNLHEYPTPGEANPPRRSDLVVGGMAGEPEKAVENQERLGNHNAISRSADSTESDPCTRFC